ncbi:MAG: hypothetical protein OQJ89_00340 [Kangiellaceae bacterium]|nr:hypothetical protein [Kangiellaceae bacterium]MCW9015387.1 hypothetical protein [Kangiellaceae bacterium]
MLDQQGFNSLNQTGLELQSSISRVIEQFPKSAQSISGLSKWLTVNRSNAQRILNAVKRSNDGVEVIYNLPGIAGLNEFVQLANNKSIESSLISKVEHAILKFQSQISEYGRSHSELKRLLTRHHSALKADPQQDLISLRELQFDATSKLLGESTEFLFCGCLIKESSFNSSFLSEHAIVHKNGIKLEEKARPFFQYYSHENLPEFNGPEIISSNTRLQDDTFQVAIADDLTSAEITAGYSGYSKIHSCLLFDELDRNKGPFDATFIFTNPDEIKNPLVSNTQSSSTAISIKNPTKRLIMMVFIEKKLDRCSTVNVGCYSTNHSVPEGQLSAKEVWSDRLPEYPELRVINLQSPSAQNIDGIEIKKYYDYLFSCSGLDPAAFVCYLMDVPFPIWSSCYRIYFEHA